MIKCEIFSFGLSSNLYSSKKENITQITSDFLISNPWKKENKIVFQFYILINKSDWLSSSPSSSLWFKLSGI